MEKKISPYHHIIHSHQFGVDFLKEFFNLTEEIKKEPLAFKMIYKEKYDFMV